MKSPRRPEPNSQKWTFVKIHSNESQRTAKPKRDFTHYIFVLNYTHKMMYNTF